MAELQNFDMVGAYSRGYGSGAQMRDDRRQQQDQAQIRALAPQVVGGDLAAYQQAAAVDPAAAQQLQGAGDVTFKRLAGAYKLVDDARKSNDIRAVNAALKQTAPFFSQVLGKPVPTEWTPDMDEGWGKLGQQIAMASVPKSTDMPTGYREFELKAQAAGLKPGTPEYQEAANIALGRTGRASSAGFSQVKFTGADGRERIGVMNGKTGKIDMADGTSFDPTSGAITPTQSEAQPVTQFTGPDGLPVNIGNDVPPEVRAAILANPAGFAGAPDGSTAQLPPTTRGAAPTAFIGRAPEEQAGLTTAAQEQAKLAVLPQTLQLQTAAGVQEATGKAEAEARVKREADLANAAQKKYVDANTTIGLLDQAEQLIGKSTGSRLGAARDTAAATFGVSTEGAQAIAQLQPIAAALTLAVPRMEGPQSDADRMLYQKAAGDFANPEVPTETRLAALQQMRVLAQKYVNTGGRPSAAPKTYSVGQTVEHNGKVYRVVGGDPSDPDLEEVR